FSTLQNQIQTQFQKSSNVNEEYGRAIRTESYLDFLLKAQLVKNEGGLSPSHHSEFCDFFLEPNQETVERVIESSVLFKKLGLEQLIVKYFDMSVEASRICSHLLNSIDRIHSSYGSIENIFSSIQEDCHRDQTITFTTQLQSFLVVSDPTFSVAKQEFKRIQDEYMSILSDLNSKRKKIAKRIKILSRLKKAYGIILPVACGLLTVATLILATHTAAIALVIGPVVLCLPMKPLRKKMTWPRSFRLGFLKKTANQLDAATRGSYIFNRDFDTMGRLIGRINDEIEHNRTMVKTCLERKDGGKYSFQVLKELKRGNVGFKEQVEELEEHVYLCLVTINKARALLLKELAPACV
ncbi:UPF0496 protein At1g20180-like, partial [Impatiens glandulifera]|uniref:UPF0496 protein At1g20180-like n=1 Tax=Impatiens glandulifera TaxID=253017 RepID=UPI001FB08C26